jgi:hypothetical protein
MGLLTPPCSQRRRRDVDASVGLCETGELCNLRHLALRKKPIGDATLIENLDGGRVQTARWTSQREPIVDSNNVHVVYPLPHARRRYAAAAEARSRRAGE